ncbi:CopD family protein [Mesorhizobium sp. SB112]|uniref:CopD family protein n=1 Tax=Mesorhizobium sp. SB112 TaxID=3151853 RepID=UPI003266F577
MVWLKFIHIAAICIWCGGLICLPGLYVQRAHTRKKEQIFRLQGLVRFAYVGIVSPAAFVAVASGTGLIFLQRTFVPWFSLKLGFVGLLVALHILTGLVIIRLFERGSVYPVWRFIAVTIVTVGVVSAILIVVLAKPDLESIFPHAMSEPGALRRLVGEFIPWVR